MEYSGGSKYRFIADIIISKIQSKELPPKSKIPSENEIIATYNVSNTTARKVLQEIEQAGLVEKIRGKGTFVKDFVVGRSASKILSFTKNMTDQGLKASTKLLDSETLNKELKIFVSGNFYNLPAPIFRVKRLRLANDVPMMVETRYISLNYCPGIGDKKLENSLYNIYRNDYNLSIVRIEQDLSAIILDKTMAKLFDIEKNSVGIKVEGVTFCGKGMILEAEESVYRGDKYKFSIAATD